MVFQVILTRIIQYLHHIFPARLKADTKELWKSQQAIIPTKQELRPQHGNTTQLGSECTNRDCDILSNRGMLVFVV